MQIRIENFNNRSMFEIFYSKCKKIIVKPSLLLFSLVLELDFSTFGGILVICTFVINLKVYTPKLVNVGTALPSILLRTVSLSNRMAVRIRLGFG